MAGMGYAVRLAATVAFALVLAAGIAVLSMGWSSEGAEAQTTVTPPPEQLTAEEWRILNNAVKDTRSPNATQAAKARGTFERALQRAAPRVGGGLARGGLFGLAAGIWYHNYMEIQAILEEGPKAIELDAEWRPAEGSIAWDNMDYYGTQLYSTNFVSGYRLWDDAGSLREEIRIESGIRVWNQTIYGGYFERGTVDRYEGSTTGAAMFKEDYSGTEDSMYMYPMPASLTTGVTQVIRKDIGPTSSYVGKCDDVYFMGRQERYPSGVHYLSKSLCVAEGMDVKVEPPTYKVGGLEEAPPTPSSVRTTRRSIPRKARSWSTP